MKCLDVTVKSATKMIRLVKFKSARHVYDLKLIP